MIHSGRARGRQLNTVFEVTAGGEQRTIRRLRVRQGALCEICHPPEAAATFVRPWSAQETRYGDGSGIFYVTHLISLLFVP